MLMVPLVAQSTTIEQKHYPSNWIALSPVRGSISEPATVSKKQTATTSIEAMVASAFPNDPVMVRIAWAESRMRPEAKNPASTASGVFQILRGTWAGYECTGDPFNASDNIACAKKIYEKEGTRPWNASKYMW